MKQLKVIVDSYNTKSGLIQASFGEPIIVKSGAKIALENFSLDVLNIVANKIVVRNSTILINTNDVSGNYNNGQRSVFIPEQVFSSTQDLMNALTNAFNSILNSDYVYNIQKDVNYVEDIGLCFINYLSGDFKNIANLTYTGVDYEEETPVTLNINTYETETNGIGYEGKFDSSWYLAYNKPVLLGGLSIYFQTKFFVNGLNAFEWGLTNTLLISTPILQYGFRIKTDNKLYLVSNGIESLLDILLAPFLNQNYIHQFYVENGKLRYQIFNPDNNTVLFKTDAGVFSDFNFINQLFFGMRGVSTAITDTDQIGIGDVNMTYQPAVQQNNVGWFLKPELLDTNVYLGKSVILKANGATIRTVNFDFTSASNLRANLGLEANVKTLASGITGSYTGEVPVSFSNYFDLALEITNLPLQSWVSNTSRNSLSKRTNILAYFTPQRVVGNARIYLYESRLLNFLSLNNKEPINISSLQFRIYNILAPSVILDCSSMTFNLFVTDDSEIHTQIVAL